MLKVYPVDTHIGKSLRFPDNNQKRDLLRAGINRTLSVPILKQKFYYYITDDFLDFYVKNKKTNHNIITYLQNEIETIYANIMEYNFYDFNYQIPELLDDIVFLFDERDSGINTNLLDDLEELISDLLSKLKEFKEIYPDELSKRYIDVSAVRISDMQQLSNYSFEIDSDIDRTEYIIKNLSKIVAELAKNNIELQKLIINEEK